jgi:heme/copper-type cytochrome/quinol oxidase subunit 2
MSYEDKKVCDTWISSLSFAMSGDFLFCQHYKQTLDGSPYKEPALLTDYTDYKQILKDKAQLKPNDFYTKYNFETHPKIWESTMAYTGEIKEFNSNVQIQKVVSGGTGPKGLLSDKDLPSQEYYQELDEALNAAHPMTCLVYPEPFVAAPSKIQHDIFFVHILLYQYWLWFFFITIIGFFVLSLAYALKTDPVQNTPKRETRGVSRSRCGDCITAIVPLSWAATIIIAESTDASDINDGHGKSEIVIGVRAYQWGWNYYFPRQPRFKHTANNNPELLFAGDALLLKKKPALFNVDNFWKWSQTTSSSSINIPAHQLLLPIDSHEMTNFFNFEDLGLSKMKESTAFKKVRAYARKGYFHTCLSQEYTNRRLNDLRDLYIRDDSSYDSYFFDVNRQHFFATPSALLPQSPVFTDKNSYEALLKLIASANSKGGMKNSPSASKDLSSAESYTSRQVTSATNGLDLKNNDHAMFKLRLLKKKSKKSFNMDNKLFYFYLNSKDIDSSPIFASSNFDLYVDSSKITTDGEDKSFISTLRDSFHHNVLEKETESKGMKVDTKIKDTTTIHKLGPLSSKKSNVLNYKGSRFAGSASIDSQGYLDYVNTLKNKEISSIDVNKFFHIDHNQNNAHSPISSNNYYSSSSDYISSLAGAEAPEEIEILSHSQDLIVDAGLTNENWDSLWLNSSSNIRMLDLLKLQSMKKNFYFPLFTEFVDYEFNDDIYFEMLEDSFWESGYSAFTADETDELLENFSGIKSRKKKLTKIRTDRDAVAVLSSLSDYSIRDVYEISYGSLTDSLTDTNLQDLFDSYESSKEVTAVLAETSDKEVLTSGLSVSEPLPFILSVDEYTNQYDENLWLSNEPWSNVRSSNSINLDEKPLLEDTFIRVKPSLSLIQNYIAVQKVLKSRFDDGISNANTSLFHMFGATKPFINSDLTPYENLIYKNFEPYVRTYTSKDTSDLLLNQVSTSSNFSNSGFLDLPFLMGKISDSSKFAWFDWYARWNSYEIQASSIARYSILGTPYFNKNFDYNLDKFEEIADSELYLLRIARARKNYLGSWINTPYLYNRSVLNTLTRFSEQVRLGEGVNSYSETNKLKSLLLKTRRYWKVPSPKVYNPVSNLNYTRSALNTPSRLTSRPFYTLHGSSAYDMTVLTDLLAKRRSLLVDHSVLSMGSKYHRVILNLALSNIKDKELIDILKATRNSKDELNLRVNKSVKILLNSDLGFITSDSYLQSFLSLRTLKTFLTESYVAKRWQYFSSYVVFKKNLFKRQHVQLRKGISALNKIHATNSIALPADTSIRVFASSKDIIHSWAIPAAGIKIDCVPGVTSHKLVSTMAVGIYTGQCMEICGRFHHYMPIVMYIIKKDLYHIWLSQAILRYFKESTPVLVTANGKKISLVTHSKLIWHQEYYHPKLQKLVGED